MVIENIVLYDFEKNTKHAIPDKMKKRIMEAVEMI